MIWNGFIDTWQYFVHLIYTIGSFTGESVGKVDRTDVERSLWVLAGADVVVRNGDAELSVAKLELSDFSLSQRVGVIQKQRELTPL